MRRILAALSRVFFNTLLDENPSGGRCGHAALPRSRQRCGLL